MAAGELTVAGAGFTTRGDVTVRVWGPAGWPVTPRGIQPRGVASTDSVTWSCSGDIAGEHTVELVDESSDRTTGSVRFIQPAGADGVYVFEQFVRFTSDGRWRTEKPVHIGDQNRADNGKTFVIYIFSVTADQVRTLPQGTDVHHQTRRRTRHVVRQVAARRRHLLLRRKVPLTGDRSRRQTSR